MPPGWSKSIPAEALLQLRQRLERLSPKNPERASQIAAMSELYGLSATSVYRAHNDLLKPHTVHLVDHGQPRVLSRQEMERYCELVAALKFRTTNKKDRHLSTRRQNYGLPCRYSSISLWRWKQVTSPESTPLPPNWLTVYCHVNSMIWSRHSRDTAIG